MVPVSKQRIAPGICWAKLGEVTDPPYSRSPTSTATLGIRLEKKYLGPGSPRRSACPALRPLGVSHTPMEKKEGKKKQTKS